MTKYIEKLRSKTNSQKKVIAISLSAAVTGVIALFWVTSFNYFYMTPPEEKFSFNSNSENSPLDVLKNGAANVYEAITGSHIKFEKEEEVSPEGISGPALEYVPD